MQGQALTLHPGATLTLGAVRISELAHRVGVPTSTVRYYERIGLVPTPRRTTSGYRDYDDASVARLEFVHRARSLGLTCEQVAEVLPIWDGINCAATHEKVSELVEVKRAEIRDRIGELERFAEQLDAVRDTLQESPPPESCLPDLSCCMPTTEVSGESAVELVPRRRRDPAAP